MYGSRLVAFSVVLLVLLLDGCGKPPVVTLRTAEQLDYNVAEFDPDYQLSAEELHSLIYHSWLEPEGGVVVNSVIKKVLDSVLIDTLAGLDAEFVDLGANWLQHRVYRNQLNNKLTITFWNTLAAQQAVADSQEVIEFYSTYPDLFHYPEQVDVYHILCSPRGFYKGPDSALTADMTMANLWEVADEYAHNLYLMLCFGEDFKSLVLAYSHDVTSRTRGGHMGWNPREKFFDPFDSVAFSHEPGEFSKPYMDRDGWHLLYIAGRYAGGVMPIDTAGIFGQAERSLLNSRANKRAGEIKDSLSQTMELEINQDVVDTANIYGIEDSTWAAVVNGMDTVDARRIKDQEEGFRRKYKVISTTPEMRHEMIRNAALPFAVVQLARKAGIDTLSEVVAYREKIWHGKCKMLVLLEQYGEKWKPPDSMIERYYNDHIEDYVPEKPLTVQHLTVQDSLLAEFLKEQAMTGYNLADLADEYREKGYDVRFADLGSIAARDVDPAYYRAALGAAPQNANIAKVAKTREGCHIIKVLEKKQVVALPMVKGPIQSLLIRENRLKNQEKFRDDLYARYNVRFPRKLPPVQVPKLKDGRLGGGD